MSLNNYITRILDNILLKANINILLLQHNILLNQYILLKHKIQLINK